MEDRQILRDKFLKHGLDKLTDEEVLELLLSFGTPRRDCKPTARAMLSKFGAIRSVFEASPEELAQVPGADPHTIIAIKIIHGARGRFLEQRLIGQVYVNSSEDVIQYLRHDMEARDKEVFKVIHLDNSNTIIKIDEVSRGSVSSTYVHPREVVERALSLKSAALVFVHNHPNGSALPSDRDIKLTRRLVHAAFLVEMVVLDHIIIGKSGEYYSFKDHGLVEIFEQEMRLTYSSPPRFSGDLLQVSNPLNDYTPAKIKRKLPARKRSRQTVPDGGRPESKPVAEALATAEAGPEFKTGGEK